MIKSYCCLLLILIMSQTLDAIAAAAEGAGYQEQAAPTLRTNVNEVTDFFPTELKDRADLDATFKGSQGAAIGGIESGFSARELEQELKLEGNPQTKASELGSISAHDLESRGISARHSEREFYDEHKLEVDYTEPLVLQHKNDVDHILKGCESFMTNILAGLKNLGIDCKTIAGKSVQEPEYNVYTEDLASQDTIYDRKFCEQLRNIYRCNNILTTRCTQVIGKPLRLNVTGTNLPIIRHDAGYLQAGSHNGHWLHGGSGTLFNYSVNFNIPKVEAIESFTIGNLNYDDFVLIKLNDAYIWSGPFGGHKLELDGFWIFTHVIIDDSGNTYSPENNTWFFVPLNINLKPHLKDGANSLNFTVVVGNKGGLLFDLHMKERECVAWYDSWEEKCTLN